MNAEKLHYFPSYNLVQDKTLVWYFSSVSLYHEPLIEGNFFSMGANFSTTFLAKELFPFWCEAASLLYLVVYFVCAYFSRKTEHDREIPLGIYL